jgi:hypothetical protein
MIEFILAVILSAPIQPVSYNWTIRPAPNPPWVTFRFDSCNMTLRSTEPVTAYVKMYYYAPSLGRIVGGQGSEQPIFFPPGMNLTVSREVPYNIPCPCFVCITQNCEAGYPHTQCGYVIRPGEPIPPGWYTPFSQLALLPVCSPSLPILLIDGFENGTLSKWRKYP